MKAGHYLTFALVGLALLPVVYVAAYYALVQPLPLLWSPGSFAHYRYGGETAERFFLPMHRVDRYLRPAKWEGD